MRLSTPAPLHAAYRYGALDGVRIHDAASNHIEDLLRFCDVLTHAATDGIDRT